MSKPTLHFPITGRAVCGLLSTVFNSDELCLVKDIETLCSSDCEELGRLWKRVAASGGETLKITDLMAALVSADQVISLSLAKVDARGRLLLIEDGILIDFSK
jgi:hypothetical protein